MGQKWTDRNCRERIDFGRGESVRMGKDNRQVRMKDKRGMVWYRSMYKPKKYSKNDSVEGGEGFFFKKKNTQFNWRNTKLEEEFRRKNFFRSR